MRIIRKILILIAIFPVAPISGQHILNDSTVLKTNKVISLVVNNCIDKQASCIRDRYEFNKNGQIVKNYPAVVAMFKKWEYLENGKLDAYYEISYDSEDSLIYSEHYRYKSVGNLDHIIQSEYNGNVVVGTDTVKIAQKIEQALGKRNSKGQIIEQQLGDLRYPCGIRYKGKHIIKYSYFSNGLIATGKIYNRDNELIVDLVYEYVTGEQ